MNRRAFLAASAVMVQGGVQQKSNFAPMDQDAYRPVMKPAKANAKPSMTDAARDQLEHDIKCMCGCTLSVYTCRTTDFSCTISPAMHRDIQLLVAGGYAAQEIIDAFVERYGEFVLMAPPRHGFNLTGYVMPFVALAAGAATVTMLLRRWTRAQASAPAAPTAASVDASADELARVQAAVRDDADEDE